MAGVQIDIVARGVCCLVPGIPGLTDNIHIISIVGRFLEHTRIFIFGRPSYDPNGEKIYIGSADLMTRNTIHRVEIAAPILDPELKKRVREYFETELKDNMQAREMMNDGTYVRVKKGEAEPMNSQEYFYEMAYREIGEPLPEEIISQPSEMEFAEGEE
jgi:polyphosphate kinase